MQKASIEKTQRAGWNLHKKLVIRDKKCELLHMEHNTSEILLFLYFKEYRYLFHYLFFCLDTLKLQMSCSI